MVVEDLKGFIYDRLKRYDEKELIILEAISDLTDDEGHLLNDIDYDLRDNLEEELERLASIQLELKAILEFIKEKK